MEMITEERHVRQGQSYTTYKKETGSYARGESQNQLVAEYFSRCNTSLVS